MSTSRTLSSISVFVLIISILQISCSRYRIKLPGRKLIPGISSHRPMEGIIRDYATNAIINDAQIFIPKLSAIVNTDALGYFKFPKVPKNSPRQLVKGDSIIVRLASKDSVVVPLSMHISFLKLFIKRSNQPDSAERRPPLDKVADMHYHISMKPHNEYGLYMYTNLKTRNDVVEKRFFPLKRAYSWSVFDNSAENDNFLLWSFRPDVVKVLYKGRYEKIPAIEPVNPTDIATYEKLKTLYEGKWIKPKKESIGNGLFNYSQATLPHLKDGNVKLAFNAISPFEYNLANDPKKRLVSKIFKSHASLNWLRTIGGSYNNKFYLTHWQNFLNEKALMQNQKPVLNNFGWQFLKSGEQLKNDTTTSFIVNVLEGSHALQGEVLMTYLYNLKEEEIEIRRQDKYSSARKEFDKNKIIVNDSIQNNNRYNKIPYDPDNAKKNKKVLDTLSKELLSQQAEQADRQSGKLAMDELRKNIATLKADSLFPIFMVTISHLSWNGMTGHSQALDTKGIGHEFIKRLYRIKASDDVRLLRQWKSLFYSEPINQFGKTLINELLSVKNGKRILVDLKHADYFTRKYFYDSVMVSQKVPPICSHCAVNGLKEIYYSPFVDEYSLIKSSADSIFYPFGLNLYDEEIIAICKNNGIIGIPLEQRVLGGYFNKYRQQLTDYSLKTLRDKPEAETGIGKIKRDNRVNFDVISAYNATEMHIVPEKEEPQEQIRALEKSDQITRDDYFSIEPFIQNLFYILDHSDTTGRMAWSHVCIGSDLDGIIDPIDVCATASQYPHFRQRLIQFIPIFLAIRKMYNPGAFDYGYYFDDTEIRAESISLRHAVDAVMYDSLKKFVINNYH